MSTQAPRIVEIEVGDDPAAWGQLGFTVDGDVCRVGEVAVRLVGAGGERGIRSWTLTGVDLGERDEIEGVVTRTAGVGAGSAEVGAVHPNTVVRIDHVVLMTPHLPRTIEALTSIGLELRRTRDTDAPEAPMRQAFFRLGEVILEVVGPPEPTPADADAPARWYGLAFTATDLDALAERLAPHVGDVKDAVQTGRRITTLRHRDVGLSVATAFMDDPSVT